MTWTDWGHALFVEGPGSSFVCAGPDRGLSGSGCGFVFGAFPNDDAGRRDGRGFIHPSSVLGTGGLLDRSNVLRDASGHLQVPYDPFGQVRHAVGS